MHADHTCDCHYVPALLFTLVYVGGGLSSFKFHPGQPKPSIGSLGETPLELSIHNGQRILSLDGGGLKGLILIEVLIHIEKLTGKKIVELFDWIVGSSTGGIIALALVYGNISMHAEWWVMADYDLALTVGTIVHTMQLRKVSRS